MNHWERYLLECTFIPPDEFYDEEQDNKEDEWGFTEYDDYLYDKYVEDKLIEEMEEKENGSSDI